MSNAFEDLTPFTGEDNTEYQKSQNINTKIVKYKDNDIRIYCMEYFRSYMNSVFSGAINLMEMYQIGILHKLKI